MQKVSSPRIITFLVITGSFLLLHFSYQNPSGEISRKAQIAADAFLKSTAKLQQTSEDFKFGRAKLQQLKTELDQTRKAYKKVEFLLEYYYPGYTEEHINGAPLLHIERYSTRPFVLPPEGLQILDEMIHSDDPKTESSQIAILTKKLQNHTGYLVDGFKKRKSGIMR
ncbi:MAG: hypothetical protein U5L96_02825 [Owenweeksia sp.]|nr:hypothetical protein [Owenweeksia sp.]